MAGPITKSIIIKGDPSRLYTLWSDFQNFPHFMKNIKEVQKTENRISHWVMEGPAGKDLEWDAQITELQENKRIAWNSIRGDIKTSGQVTFNDLGRNNETEITVVLQYVPPAGKLGEMAAQFFDHPEKKLEEDLRRFKKYAEKMTRRFTTGAQPASRAVISGNRKVAEAPARPSAAVPISQDSTALDREEIERLAYQLYLEKGGSAMDNWLEAERLFKEGRREKVKSSASQFPLE